MDNKQYKSLGCFQNPIPNISLYQCVYSDVLRNGMCFEFCDKNGIKYIF